MPKMFRTLLLWSLILGACSAIPMAPQTVAPTAEVSFSAVPNTTAPNPKFVATLSTPHIDQGPDGPVTSAPPDAQNCGYQWAYQDLPELSSSFQRSIQALQPQAQASTYLFGENCILPDGSIGQFLVKETDFKVTLQVEDLSNESALGDWIVDVMHVITAIPPDHIAGPQPGMVSIIFQSSGDQKAVNFYIDRYRALPSGLSSTEIFQAFRQPE